MVGRADPVPAVPQGQQRVRREVVGGVRLARQQMGEPGQLGVVALEEGVELRGGGVVTDCPHGGLSSQRLPGCRTPYGRPNPNGPRNVSP